MMFLVICMLDEVRDSETCVVMLETEEILESILLLLDMLEMVGMDSEERREQVNDKVTEMVYHDETEQD